MSIASGRLSRLIFCSFLFAAPVTIFLVSRTFGGWGESPASSNSSFSDLSDLSEQQLPAFRVLWEMSLLPSRGLPLCSRIVWTLGQWTQFVFPLHFGTMADLWS